MAAWILLSIQLQKKEYEILVTHPSNVYLYVVYYQFVIENASVLEEKTFRTLTKRFIRCINGSK